MLFKMNETLQALLQRIGTESRSEPPPGDRSRLGMPSLSPVLDEVDPRDDSEQFWEDYDQYPMEEDGKLLLLSLLFQTLNLILALFDLINLLCLLQTPQFRRMKPHRSWSHRL